MDHLALRSASELAAAIVAREISSRELLDVYCNRIERHGSRVNAVIGLDLERARERAVALDARLARGEVVGPLHGLPITIKDAFETAGLRTTTGAAAYAAHVPARNATAVQRLVDAGAIVFGKTNVPAHCADVQTYNALFGTTCNPYDLTRTPGGSSGGAAAAVACGFTAFELGSDIGGSIRTPANFTGIFGHKPSHGLVPQRGHIPGPPGALTESDLNVCGPLARSAEDLALLLSVLAGPDGARAKAWRLSLPPARRGDLRDYRIAVWLDDPAFPVDAEVRGVLESAVEALRAAGARVDYQARPEVTLTEIIAAYEQLLDPIIASGVPQPVFEHLLAAAEASRPEGQADDAYTRFAHAATQRHVQWLRAHERRLRHCARLSEFFQRFDALLCPVTPVAAIAHDHEGTQTTRTIRVNGEPRPYMDLLSWVAIASAAHLPATVAPVGTTAAGLPVGIQVIGDAFDDLTTIDVARRLAALRPGFVPPAGF